jgi:hypothetical protein
VCGMYLHAFYLWQLGSCLFSSMNWTESDRIRIEIFLFISSLTWNRLRGTCRFCFRCFNFNVQQKVSYIALQARSKLRTSWLFNFYERSGSLMKLRKIFSSRLQSFWNCRKFYEDLWNVFKSLRSFKISWSLLEAFEPHTFTFDTK